MNRRDFLKGSGALVVCSLVTVESSINTNPFKDAGFDVPKHDDWVDALKYPLRVKEILKTS